MPCWELGIRCSEVQLSAENVQRPPGHSAPCPDARVDLRRQRVWSNLSGHDAPKTFNAIQDGMTGRLQQTRFGAWRVFSRTLAARFPLKTGNL